MKININTGVLSTNDDQFLKKMNCPISVNRQSMTTTDNKDVMLCSECKKNVVAIDDYSDAQLIELFKQDSNTCVMFNVFGHNVKIIE